MILAAQNIWDTRIQSVCAAVTAADGGRIEVFMSGNFAQVTLAPPRLVINPNRLYPIEPTIRRARRFALNVFRASQRVECLALIRIRRREPDKLQALGWTASIDHHGIPFLGSCLRTVFCELEDVLEAGDHAIMIARILESRPHGNVRELPLLYPEVSGVQSRFPRMSKALRAATRRAGVLDWARRALRRTPRGPVDLAAQTFVEGGQTEAEIAEITRHGILDGGRTIAPPRHAPAVLRQRASVCVVGVGGWGAHLARIVRRAGPQVDLYVCGRDATRVRRVAHACGAKDGILGLEAALADPRFQTLVLALPHDLHCETAMAAVAAGKHVLVEKPIALTLADADRMIAMARQAGRILMVAEDMHFRPAIREAVRLTARGAIGEPLYLLAHAGGIRRPTGWQAEAARLGGGVLMDLGVHYVRALRLLLGEPDRVLATRAMQVNTKMEGEDSAEVLFASGRGWRGHLLLSWSSLRGHAPDLVLAGEQGTLHLWPGAPYLDLYPAQQTALQQVLDAVPSERLAKLAARPWLSRVRTRIVDDDRLGYVAEMREFLGAVAEDRQPVTPPEDARRDLEVVLAAYTALRQERWVDIPSAR